MTIKETYSTGNDADCWVDIPLETFRSMTNAGYSTQYTSLTGVWRHPACSVDAYTGVYAPFRTKHSEYMRYINRTYPMWIGTDMGFDMGTLFRCTTQEDERTAPEVRTARDERKSRPDLLPSKAVLAAGRVLAFGLSKHPDEKWKTLSVEDHVAASLRHIYQHQDGPDEETGESHLAHALCRIAFAIARDNDEGSDSE